MRLTEVDDNGNWRLDGVEWKQIAPGGEITGEVWGKLCGAFWKLKNYEDTDLTPDQVSELQDETQEQARQMLERVAKLSDEIDRMKEEKGQRWIPVTERLPARNERVLLCMKHKSTSRNCIPVGYLSNGAWFILSHTGYESYATYEFCITAWMPLPEPYKEDDENENEEC